MKALFVPFAPSLAHVSRCLAVAETLRTQGHIAVFAIGTERVDIVQKAGFETHSLPEVPGDVFRIDRGFRWLTSEYVEQNIKREQTILNHVQPDVVIFDFRFTSAMSTHLAGLPSVSIVHGNALRLAIQPHKTAQLLLGNLEKVHGIAALRLRVMQRLFPNIFLLVMRSAVHHVNVMRKKYGLETVKTPFELLLGDKIFVADIPSLLKFELPSNCSIVGPLMWSGWTQQAPWLDELDSKPLIYVTMGSTVEAKSGIIKIIEALYSAPYNVVISTGSLSLPTNLKLPSHIYVFSTVPGDTVLQQCAAVIHHGGHGTLMQALKAGVPSLMLPVNPDQLLVTQQAQMLGVAHSLWHPDGLPISRVLRKMTSSQIRCSINELIVDQDCLRACQKFKQEVENYHGASAAMETLIELIQPDKEDNSSL